MVNLPSFEIAPTRAALPFVKDKLVKTTVASAVTSIIFEALPSITVLALPSKVKLLEMLKVLSFT